MFRKKQVRFRRNPVKDIMIFDKRLPVLYLNKQRLFDKINEDKNIKLVLNNLKTKKNSNNVYYIKVWVILLKLLKKYNIPKVYEDEWIARNIDLKIINRISKFI